MLQIPEKNQTWSTHLHCGVSDDPNDPGLSIGRCNICSRLTAATVEMDIYIYILLLLHTQVYIYIHTIQGISRTARSAIPGLLCIFECLNEPLCSKCSSVQYCTCHMPHAMFLSKHGAAGAIEACHGTWVGFPIAAERHQSPIVIHHSTCMERVC